MHAAAESVWDSTGLWAVVSVAVIDRSLPQSDRQADGQEMTNAFPVAMETWRVGVETRNLAWGSVEAP